MTASEHQAAIDALIDERQQMNTALESNRIKLADAIRAQTLALAKPAIA